MRPPPNPIEIELAAEQAASLGRSGKQLRKALDMLAQFDAAMAHQAARRSESKRTQLVQACADAFYGYIVQRELLGLQDSEYIANEYGVPREVLAIAGRIGQK